MDKREFSIVEKIVREAILVAPTAAMRRHVNHLRLCLNRQATRPTSPTPDRTVAADITIKSQAAEIARLLARLEPPAPRAHDQIAPPTPETARKRRRDSLRHLVGRGSVGPEQERAAYEIVEVMELLQDGMRAQSRDPNGGYGAKSVRQYRSAFERMHDRLFEQWKDRFLPWAEEMEALPVQQSNIVRGSRFDVLVSVLVEGYTLRELEFLMALKNGSLTPLFVGALTRYAQIAGWLDAPH